jgi:hypothetical protein
MENSISGFAKLMASLFVFITVCLAIGGIAYQLFAADGQLFLLGKHLWETHPLQLVMLGACAILIKRWLDGLERSAKIADAMIYLAVLVGMFFGYNLLAASLGMASLA